MRVTVTHNCINCITFVWETPTYTEVEITIFNVSLILLTKGFSQVKLAELRE